MARFPKVPGAGPKQMGNPVYWTRMELQNRRYAATTRAAAERFNERWKRLGRIQNMIAEDFVDEIIEDLEGREAVKLSSLIDDMQSWNREIDRNIDLAKNADLSKYATRIKKVGLFAIGLCKNHGKYTDIEDFFYDTKEKMMYINGEAFYYLG